MPLGIPEQWITLQVPLEPSFFIQSLISNQLEEAFNKMVNSKSQATYNLQVDKAA